MVLSSALAAGSPRVTSPPPKRRPGHAHKRRTRCLYCEDRKARKLRVPEALNKQLFFCSASCAIQFAILEARLQGLTFCTKCKEWAGRPDSLCSCPKDDATLAELQKSANAENGGDA